MSKTITKWIALSMILFCSALSAETKKVAPQKTNAKSLNVHNSAPYFDVGLGPFPLIIPHFGLGYRIQENHHGADFSLRVASLGFITEVKTSALYLHYFNPNLESQLYVGTGIGTGGLFANKHSKLLLSPEFLIGQQYTNKSGDQRFIQAQVSWPTTDGKRIMFMPLVVFSYGFCF